MVKKLLVALFASALLVSVGTVPAEAHHPRGDIYEQESYDEDYEFEDSDCGFTFVVKGNTKGRFINYNVRGSDGQAFLNHNWYFYREMLTNPANGKKMYISGTGYFREVAARQVKGDVWEFTAVETGRPFVVRDARGRIVLMDRGKLVTSALFDTLGDSQPGAEFIKETYRKAYGSFPSLEPDFDFCAMVGRLIG